MVKQILILLISFFTLLTEGQQPRGFEITGKITNAEGKKMYLTQRGNGLLEGTKVIIQDSCFVNNGIFHFNGWVDKPDYYSIFVANGKGWKYFILDNLKFSFTGDADSIWKAKVLGSRDQELLDSLKIYLKPYLDKEIEIADKLPGAKCQSVEDKYRSIVYKYEGDTVKSKELLEQYNLLKTKIQTIRIDFIRKNPGCFESLNQLSLLYMDINKEQSKELFNILSDNFKNYTIGKEIRYQLFEIEKLFTQPLSFSLPDTTGKLVNFNSFRGNYLLVDFWASWCGPCRSENSRLKKIYEKYRGKGFNVIAITLDLKKEDWIKAINQDELRWQQVSDLTDKESNIALKYGIKSIPFNFLLDKEGKIIAKKLSAEELQKKLSEIYD